MNRFMMFSRWVCNCMISFVNAVQTIQKVSLQIYRKTCFSAMENRWFARLTLRSSSTPEHNKAKLVSCQLNKPVI